MVAGTESTAAPPVARGRIPGLLAESVRRDPRGTYLVDGGREHSFEDVSERARLVRDRLAARGIGPGDRVVLWLPNGLDWVACFFALLELGVIVVPASTRLRAPELEHVLADSGASTLVYSPAFLGIDFDRMVNAIASRARAGLLPRLVNLVSAGETTIEEAVRLDELPATGTGVHGLAPEDAAAACYTSGTTGRPKGCLHTHGALVHNASVAAGLTGLSPGERIVCPVPFSHVFGFHMGVIQAAYSGATLISAEPFDADRVLDLCSEQGATVLYAVPTMAREIVAAQRRSPRPLRLRLALVAGAPVSSELRSAVAAEIADGVGVTYGCTEAPTISQLLPDDQPAKRAESVGRPTPGVEVRIASPGTIDPLPAGEVGEILVRGYNTMSGYLGDPAATRAKLREGWLVTGDLGALDADGFLQFAARADDALVVGGFNAYPREIEARLEQLEGVEEVAVVGVPDERLGQVPMAWVVAPGSKLDPEAVLAFSREHLASFKRPRYVRIVDRLPQVASGKVARADLLAEARRVLPGLDWEGAPR